MSKPATEMRLARAAEGFTQVIGRGNAHIITRNPTTGKCAYDGQVLGGWHYGAGLETDTTLEPDTDINYWKMVKALYNIRVRKSFSAGDLLKWTDPTTGQYVILQPNNLSWVDHVTDSQQFISSPAAVTGQVTDDVALWSAAYGSGRHLRCQAGPLRLTKHLIIDAAANLPTPTVSNPHLEIAFVMTPSSGVSLRVDGTTWGKKTKKNTANAIEFRTSGGVTLWSFAAPKAFDSAGNEIAGILQLRKQGANFIAAVRFPKSFFDTAAAQEAYPIYIDPTVDYQTGSSGNDGTWITGITFSTNGNVINIGSHSVGAWKSFAMWPTVTISAGATIDTAYLSFYYQGVYGTPAECDLYFEDAANPSAITSAVDGDGRTKTTASIKITGPSSGTWWNSNSIVSIIQELVDTNSYASGAAMQALVVGPSSGLQNYSQQRSYDYSGNVYGPKLHIEYTEASIGNPYYAYAQQ